MGWPLLWAVWLAINAQLEAEARVRKLEELKLEKDIQLSTILLFSGLTDKVEEQNNLETLACHFSKLGGHKLPWMKIQVLVTKPD